VAQLYTGKPPFASLPHDPAAMLQAIAGKRPPRPRDQVGRPVPDHIWDIIELCWTQLPHERPSMKDVVGLMKAANPDLVVERHELHFGSDSKSDAAPPLLLSRRQRINRPPNGGRSRSYRPLHHNESKSF
jgi:hypothetical protein